jgi:RNA polymerase sigma-70 factor (ECF subfamily)
MVAFLGLLGSSHNLPSPAEESDAILAGLAIRDPEAFASLYMRYVEEIGRFCYLRLHDQEAARDATQQIFAQALAGLSHYRESGQFRAWLYTIARHVLANNSRDRRITVPLDVVAETVDPGATLEETTASAWDRRAVLEAVARLPADQRTAVELRLAGLRGPEIATAMGRSHDAVKKLQLRALEKLRHDLGASLAGKEGRHGAR